MTDSVQTQEMPEDPFAGELTLADRCDRCSAAAAIRVAMNAGGTLLFCGHHGRAHQAELIKVGVIFGELWTE